MGELRFYLLNEKETDYNGINALIDSRLEGKEVSYIALNQLSDKKMIECLKPINVDGYFNPYDDVNINKDKLKELLNKGISFHVKSNINNLDKLKEVFEDFKFSYEH